MSRSRPAVRLTIAFVAMMQASASAASNAAAQSSPADSLAKVSPALARLVPSVPTPSFVADVPRLLSAEEHARIDARIRAHQDAGFGDIAIAIIPSVGDYAPNQVALAIYRTWRVGTIAPIGSARRNLGVLLLVVPKELAPDHKGQCFISTGPGVQGDITDAMAASICRDAIIPELRQKAYAAAVMAGIEEISARLARDPALAADSAATVSAPLAVPAPFVESPTRAFEPGVPIGLGILGLIGAGAYYVRWRRRYHTRICPRCGKPMQRLGEQADDQFLSDGQRLEEGLKSVDYDVWHCECGEHQLLPYVKMFSGYTECSDCHVHAVKTISRIVQQPTRYSTGLAVKTHHCENCRHTTTSNEVLPQLPEPCTSSSSSSFSSDSGSSSSGGSFGGSGSNDGGGGGSSY